MESTPVSLLKRLQAEPSEETWAQLVALYNPFIRAWLLRQGVQSADADDLTQEVLRTLVEELPTFEHRGPGCFRAWLRGIAANRLKNWRRKQGRQPGQLPGQDVEDRDGIFERLWDAEHDRYVLRRLLEMIENDFEKPAHEAFRRLVVEGHKAGDVARDLGLSVNAIYISKSRVLSRLRELSQGILD